MLSQKKKREIRSIGFDAFHEVVKSTDDSKEMTNGWYNEPPETWNASEKLLWDSLSELESKIISNVIELLSKPKTL